MEGAAAAGDADRGAMAELSDSQRAALQMLAASTRGYSLSTLRARGFAYEMLRELVRAGHATAHRDAVGLEKKRVAYLRITAKGRKAIAT